MKKILVPCDFSPTAQQAYTFALDIAKKTDAGLYVLNVLDTPFMVESYSMLSSLRLNPELWTQVEKDARERFNKIKAAHTRQSDITFRIIQGSVTATILDFIQKEEIDLVVMGTNGSSGLDEYLIGSNTEKIVRFSQVPVFAVRKAINLSSIKNIVFPTDLALDQAAFVNKVKELQGLFGAILHVLTINTPSNMHRNGNQKREMEEFVKHYDIHNYSLNSRNEFGEEEGIIGFAEETKADMVAMGTHGRRGLAHLFAGSIAENVVNHITCPIWTYTVRKH
jgi:nucleotide-binding universal stress UspA family protein